MFTVCDLHFAYNGRPILTDINFSVERGELLAVLGPNGVGKTTLLKCMNAMQRPSAGVVLMEEQDILTLPPANIARDIGYVSQKNEASRLTVFDAVLMGRSPHIRWRMHRDDLDKVSAVIHSFGLTHLCMRYMDTLSGGEVQKVCIARALVQEPSLLLLDEPTSALDLKNQVEMMQMIRRLVNGRRLAVVMTMHDVNMALRYADRAVFLKKGGIHAITTPDRVTAEMIRQVYGLPVHIHRLDGQPVVLPQT
ncbi:MAG: ABC transporter ATP-binding protein [Desulfobulbus oligotrophicus]|jgi:iron complex transport system ATP-binding protein|nr:ABC transporter ATP-binding protein [Desulfobulbus oligotrophicus]